MRTVNRLISIVLGLAVAAVGVLLAGEAIQLDRSKPSWVLPRHAWAHHLRFLQWDSSAIRLASIVLIVVGAVLFLLQLVPRQRVRFRLESKPGRARWVSRRGVQRRLAVAVDRDAEVESVKARVRRHKANVRVSIASSSDNPRPRLEHALRSATDELGLTEPLRFRLRVKRGERRVQ